MSVNPSSRSVLGHDLRENRTVHWRSKDEPLFFTEISYPFVWMSDSDKRKASSEPQTEAKNEGVKRAKSTHSRIRLRVDGACVCGGPKDFSRVHPHTGDDTDTDLEVGGVLLTCCFDVL